MTTEQSKPAAEAETPEEETAAAETVSPEDRIADLEKQLADAKDAKLRALAEAQNTRQRIAKDIQEHKEFAVAPLAQEILDLADTFERALQNVPASVKNDDAGAKFVEGIEKMRSMLQKAFEKHGIREIDAAGQPFDPNYHEAMLQQPVSGDEDKPDHVAQVLQKGYIMKDKRVLRAAKVSVFK